MSTIATGAVHHIMLTVSNLDKARSFYRDVLGTQIVADDPEGRNIAFTNGTLLLATHLPPDPTQTPEDDLFSEHRMGLDHLSLSVSSRADLDNALSVLEANNVPHGEIKDLSAAGFPMLVLAFRDPDNIQLELTAPTKT